MGNTLITLWFEILPRPWELEILAIFNHLLRGFKNPIPQASWVSSFFEIRTHSNHTHWAIKNYKYPSFVLTLNYLEIYTTAGRKWIPNVQWKINNEINMIYFSANFLEIEVCKPITHTDERGKRYTDYEVHMRTNLPIFK